MSDITLSKAVRSNLLSLQGTADLMAKTQERLATGNKVNSALDNPTNFFTASALNSRAGDLNALMDNMANGIKTIEAADNGLTSITKTLESMQSTLRQARQDKSFQVGTFDVTADTVLDIAGGTLPAPIKVELADPYAGKKAVLTTPAAYAGPALAGTQGGGARSDITWDASMDGTVDVVTVDEIGLDLSAVGITDAATAATAMQTQLNTARPGEYTVTEAAGVISIEKTDTSKPSPAVNLGNTAATPGSAKFTFDPARMGTTIDVDGTPVTVNADMNTFVEALKTQLGTDYTVTSDAVTKEITVKSNIPGSASTPVIGGGNLAATPATTSFSLDKTEASALTVGGTTVYIAAGATDASIMDQFVADPAFDAAWTIASDNAGNFTVTARTNGAPMPAPIVSSDARAQTTFAFNSNQDGAAGGLGTAQAVTIGAHTLNVADDATDAQVLAQFRANGPFNSAYHIFSQGPGQFTVISKTGGTGAENGPTASGGGVTGSTPNNVIADTPNPATVTGSQAGQNAVPVTQVTGGDGATVEAHDAPTDSFTVTYGTKTLELKITRGTPEEMAKSINDQFAIAGIDLKASFDVDGKMSFEATKPETKTLAISGATGNTLFGATTVSIGENAVDPLNATKAVDKFVELINRDYGTSIRASNDNGRLRIENLSTSEMSVDADKDGNGAIANTKIAGNSVRAGLADQFNDLKNQLDRLSDDASFNGINLLRGDNLRITFNESGNSFIEIQTADHGGLNANTLKISDLNAEDLDADVSIDGLLNEIKLSLAAVRTQASQFGSNLSIVQNRQDFTKQMINTLETGAANLTLADMNEEAANLLALQTRQSLSSSSLSLASQADQSVLQLLQ